ncbi:hypothetical protein [Streptomyces sp. NPDC097619]|uniref:hypothetical protein n=1 Tax=Streptomyces sp. NPDC097619 TaxID=3157228 RepID=UPI00332C9B1C
MSELLEFDDLAQVEVLLRAGMEFKFETPAPEGVLLGSPVYAASLARLRDGLQEALRTGPLPSRVKAHVEWYRLVGHPHRWAVLAERAAAHPRWHDLTEAEAREWLEALASPLTVDDEAYRGVRALIDARP